MTSRSDTACPGDPSDTVGLSPSHLEAIQRARRDGRRIARAAGVASFSGWTLAVFAFFTLLGGLFSLPAFLLGIGLSVLAVREIRGGKGLRRLELRAPRSLGVNQLVLGVVLVAWGGWGVWNALAGESPYQSYLDAGGPVAESLEPIDSLMRLVSVAFYAAVAVISMIACGCMSIYYFSRRRQIESHLAKTPAWVVETLRAAA